MAKGTKWRNTKMHPAVISQCNVAANSHERHTYKHQSANHSWQADAVWHSTVLPKDTTAAESCIHCSTVHINAYKWEVSRVLEEPQILFALSNPQLKTENATEYSTPLSTKNNCQLENSSTEVTPTAFWFFKYDLDLQSQENYGHDIHMQKVNGTQFKSYRV